MSKPTAYASTSQSKEPTLPGPPLPRLPEFWYFWGYLFRALAQAGYHVVAPDLRGYSQTDQPEAGEAYTLRLVGDLAGTFYALGEQEAMLVGHDWGSVLAWRATHCALTTSQGSSR